MWQRTEATQSSGSRCRPTAVVLATTLLLATVATSLAAQYPRFEDLNRSDELFVQHQSGIQEYYRSAGSGADLPPLLLYEYVVQEDDTLFGIAARFSLPYSAIATLNHLTDPTLTPGRSLIVPGIPGVFVPVNPRSDLASIMHDLRSGREAAVVTVVREDTRTAFRFFAGEDFLPEERNAFLGLIFRHPLPEGRLSSPYGNRMSPITAQWSFHGGADYAAAAGTRVLAARAGVVSEVGFNEILGNYVVLTHSGGFETLYGHLASSAVSLNQEVRSGMILGAVGSTGAVTGPHLHFEIRQRGRARDPEGMLP